MLIPINYYSVFTVGDIDDRTLFYLYGYGEIDKEDYSMTVNDLAITSLETITVFRATGEYLFTLDELQNATISQSQESTDITGKAGRKLSTLKRNKTFSLSASNGLVSTGLLAAQTGGTLDSGASTVLWTEEVEVNGTSAFLTYRATGTEGAEIKHLFVKNADGTLGRELTQVATIAQGDIDKFTYAYGKPQGSDEYQSKLTFAFDGTKDDVDAVYVIYERTVTADHLSVDDDISDVKVEIFVDAICEDKCANQFHLQIHIPKADMSAEFSLEMGDNQAVHSFQADALAGKCGVGGNFWEWTVFGVNAADYAA